MARTVDLVPGVRYWAGADLPWFVPQGVVSAAARDLGFDDPVWHDRADAPPINPRSDPEYADDWTSWATATYVGTAQRYGLPKGLKWFVAERKEPKQTAPSPKPAATTDANVKYAEEQLRIANEALASGKPELMLQAAEYFRGHNMRELGQVLEDAAGNAQRDKARAVAIIATGIGLVIATGLTLIIALRKAR